MKQEQLDTIEEHVKGVALPQIQFNVLNGGTAQR